MGYATISNGHVPSVRKSSDTKVIRAMWINGWYAVLKQTSSVTDEEWRGLSKTDAESLCVSSEVSVLGEDTRNYLGGARSSHLIPFGVSFLVADDCWGTKVVSSMERIGDSNLYRVKRTTTVLEVTAPTGTLTLL